MKTRCKIILPAAAILFAGLAGGQVAGSGAGGGALSCTNSTPLIPTARAESMTEIVGDLVLTCSGGQPMAAGSAIPTARITLYLGTNVTSRILVSPDISEAMLLIDEPGAWPAIPAPVPGFGPAAAQNACNNFALGAGEGGCVQYAFTTTDGVPIASSSPNSLTPPANIFFGAVRQNQVIFNGIPILPPVTAGISRVFRITNVRANISGLGGGGLAGTTQVLSSLSVDPSLPINNPVQIAAFPLSAVDVALRNADNTGGLNINSGAILGQLSETPTAVAVLQFHERFAGALRTRVAATRDYDGQAAPNTVVQNVPGTAYHSESGLVFTGRGSFNGSYPGLADYGTRLKAVFNNIPVGVRLFVSVTNLAANSPSRSRQGTPATRTSDSYAVLVTAETDADGNGSAPVVNPASALAEISIVNGGGTAVWEVLNTNSQALETFSFRVWASSSAAGPAALGTAVVNMSLAPSPATAFAAVDAAQASALLPLPRFADTSVSRAILTVGPSACQYSVVSDFPRTVAAGGGTGTFTVTTGAGCSWWATGNATWLHITSGFNGSGPGAIGVSVDANTSSGSRLDLISVAGQNTYVNQAGTSAPLITPRGIVDPWNSTPGVAAGAWVSIYGSNLASVTQDWQPQPGAKLPTSLGGVTVAIDGMAAPLQHVSPTSINALAPAGVHEGQVEAVVYNQNVGSAPISVTSSRYLPAIYSLLGGFSRYYVTAADPSTGQYLGNVTVDRRVARPVRTGDTIDLYAIGLGPTTPAFPTDTLFSDSYAVSSPFHVVLSSTTIVPVFARLIGPGLYQVRITVPLDLPAGDLPIWIDFGTVESAQGVYLTVQQ